MSLVSLPPHNYAHINDVVNNDFRNRLEVFSSLVIYTRFRENRRQIKGLERRAHEDTCFRINSLFPCLGKGIGHPCT